jgi:DNA polymerase III subunit beta
MQYSCTQENIKTALQLVGPIAARQGSLPILSNVLMRVDAGIISIIATSIELTASLQLRGKAEEEGSFTASAKLLGDVVQLLPRTRVDLRVNDAYLELRAGGHHTKVRGMDVAEFPIIPDVPSEPSASLGISALRRALAQVIFAVAGSAGRQELSGVLLLFREQELVVVATDSHRLGEAIIPLTESAIGSGTSVIVPARTIQELLRILGSIQGVDGEASEVRVTVSGGQLAVRLGSFTLLSQLIDRTYPDYAQILPKEWTTQVRVARTAIQNATRAAGLFARAGVHDIHLHIIPKESRIVVRSENAQLGEHEASLDVVAEGDELTTILNARYLLEGLAAFDDDELIVRCTQPVAPVVISGFEQGEEKAEGQYQYVIMPIKQ